MPTTEVKERPIIFSAPMIRALIEGRKSQTRRVVKNPDWLGCLTGDCPHDKQTECDASLIIECPYGVPGERLWVRETWAPHYAGFPRMAHYRADLPADRDAALTANHAFGLMQWRSPIHMPRWASRITLEITEVSVERLHEMSDACAVQEGFSGWYSPCHPDQGSTDGRTPREEFAETWDALNGKRGYPWSSNPWVWALTFKVLLEIANVWKYV